MSGKDIFLGLKYVGDDLIQNAEYGQFPTDVNKSGKKENARKRIRRPLMVAALIAILLMLVGCAVVYVLKMQDIKIGDTTETRAYRLVDGIYIEDIHEVNQNVLTLAGLQGSKTYQACADFFSFKEEYTKNMEAMMRNGTLPEDFFENNTFGKTMNAKAAELAEKYGLNQEGEYLEFRTTRNMCNALGVERFLRESAQISARVSGGGCYDTGNFFLYFDFDFPDNQEYEVLSTSGYLRWNRTDCFSRDYVTLVDSGDWIERNYTTSSGSEVLILQSPTQERGYILCDRGDALMSLQLDVNIELLSEDNGIVSAEYLHMTDRQIELVADIIDFSVQPRIPTQADVENQMGISQSPTQNGWTISVKTVETDGYVVQITLGIAGPEGTVIPEEGSIIFSNHGTELVPASGKVSGCGGTTELVDDGDGLENTFDLKLIRECTMEDGSAPFAIAIEWNLHIVDIEYSCWDTENNRILDDTLAEAEWLFPITFDESMGDYTERELIREPLNVGVSVGWSPDGSDVVEDVKVTSFKLRKFSAIIAHNGEEGTDFSWLNGEYLRVVMKDGSEIQLSGGDGYLYGADSPIDLDYVDHILFADGTKLEVSHLDIDSSGNF